MTKEVDETSAKLALACASGQPFGSVTIVAERLVGDDYRQFLRVEMTDVVISSFQTGGTYNGDIKPTDQVKFSFAKIDYKHSAADDRPNATGRPDAAK